MGKKLCLAFIFALLCSTLSFGIASAVEPMYVAHTSGGAADTVFNFGENPWLSTTTTGFSSIDYWWTDTPSTGDYWSFSFPASAGTKWLQFSDINFYKFVGGVSDGLTYKWNDFKHNGLWNINASIHPVGGTSYDLTYAFNIVPEPISSTLFLLGGGALVARIYRKKKKTA